MKKMTKRLTALLLVTVMTALCMLPVSAVGAGGTELIPGVIVSVGEPDTSRVQPRSQQIYSETVGGSKRFTGGFSCYGANGQNMEFTIENTGSTTIHVKFTAYVGSETGELEEFKVQPGDTRSVTATTESARGLNASFSFVLNTYSATEGMYCNLYAEQY